MLLNSGSNHGNARSAPEALPQLSSRAKEDTCEIHRVKSLPQIDKQKSLQGVYDDQA